MQILFRRHTVFNGISHLSCNVKCRVIISVNIKTFNPFPDKPLSKLQHNRFITEYKIFAPKTVMFARVKPVIPHNKAT